MLTLSTPGPRAPPTESGLPLPTPALSALTPFAALPIPEKEMGLSATLPPRPSGLHPLLPCSLWTNTFPHPLARALPQVWRGAGSRLGIGGGGSHVLDTLAGAAELGPVSGSWAQVLQPQEVLQEHSSHQLSRELPGRLVTPLPSPARGDPRASRGGRTLPVRVPAPCPLPAG